MSASDFDSRMTRQAEAYNGYPNYWRGPPNARYNWNQQPLIGQPVWRSQWVPMRNLGAMSGDRLPMYAFAAPDSRMDMEAVARQYYPQLFRPKPSLSYGSEPVIDLTSAINRQRALGSQRQPITQILATCERRDCYISCRLNLLGGGRCTSGGCMCYFNYLNYDGAPMQARYPDDNIWYELDSDDKAMILDAMREGKRGPPHHGSDGNGHDDNPVTGRPSYGQRTTTGWYGDNVATKPPYQTTQGWGGGWAPEATFPPATARPTAGGNWWGSGDNEVPKATNRPPYVEVENSGGSFFDTSGDDDDDDNTLGDEWDF
eukprot:snap_masked-scaffold355_size198070-processed-gene-0.14 protein:Tk03299 transcript:snap_masked-scaffold355_size198070-processed-gene-0.14-mRNA-1 annotation:"MULTISPECIES: hypothetical protein"